MKLIRLALLLLSCLITNLIFAQNNITKISKTPFTIGETLTFKSDVLQEERAINIYLPASYHPDSTNTYPVIYLLDGSKDEDFIHIAGLVQFASFSWIKMIPETIVVGIGNVDRRRDFTYPSNDPQDVKEFPTTGGSAKFMEFLDKELRPLIEKTYRPNDISTLIGQSLGGLLATEILFKQPEWFSNYIIVSPSLWWDKEELLKYNPKPYTREKNIYIAVGKEGPWMERVARELHVKLAKTLPAETSLFFKYLEERDHG
ncbi:MAG: alpha/beta hydrolase, partial [Saprospiraceae bacterium]